MGNNTILSRVFTQNTLASILNDDFDSSIIEKVIRRYDISDDDIKSNAQLFSEIYCAMQKHYRNEYFYKNTILNKLLINAHRLNTTVALTEIPIAKSKADFIMINGKAVVYEIKTALDTLDRLENQIADYYKAFDHVCVLGSESKKQELLSRFEDSPVGVYILTSKDTISHVQEPKEYRDALDIECLFKILRKKEYESIVRKLRGCIPEVSPVKLYQQCKDIICSYAIETIYPLILEELKSRNRIEIIDYSTIPEALHFLIYFSKLRNKDIDRLTEFLKKQYPGVD